MKRIALGEIASISSGGTPDRQHPNFWNGKIPWVKTGEIQFNIIRDTEEKITDLAIVRSSTKVYSAGTLLMAMYGQGKTRGQVAVLDIDAAINQACAAIIPSDKEDTRYLFQYLSYQYSNIRRLSNSGSQENLNAELIRSIPVYYPEKSVRNKIAEILSAWDDGLEKLDALIAAKERSKKGLMQQLLTGKRRVKGFSGKWMTMKLGELFSERVEQGRGDLPLLSITADQGIVMRDGLVKRDTSSEDKSKYLRIAPGDIGYNTMRMWQGVSALSSLEGIISPAYTVCIPSKSINGRFAAHFFKLSHTIDLFRRHSQGLVDDTLNLKYSNFTTIEVQVPSDVKEQRAIADILDACDDELRLLCAQREAFDQQKRGLMQRMLTGRTRVETRMGTRTDTDGQGQDHVGPC